MPKGPNPELLRQSAATLLQIASDIEAGEKKDIEIHAELEVAYSPIFFGRLDHRSAEFGQRLDIADLGLFSDAALAIILAAMNSPDGYLEVQLGDLETITGLPISSSLRLLKELSARQAIRLEQSAYKTPSVRLVASAESQRIARKFLPES